MRRIENDEYLSFINDLIGEGFEFEDGCEYYEFGDYLREVLYGAIITFMNTYDNFDNINERDQHIVYDFLYKFMNERYGDKILKRYESDLLFCDDEDDN